MTTRRVVIVDAALQIVYPEATRKLMRGERSPALGSPAAIDMSDIPNADARAPMLVRVEEQCDHGEWHVIGQTELLCWSDDSWKKRP